MLSFFDKALLNMLTIAAVRGKKIWNGTVRDRRDTFPWLYDVRAKDELETGTHRTTYDQGLLDDSLMAELKIDETIRSRFL